ncbi:MAG: hypothetical protein QM778_10825 [Myxococcales bacterium]
MLQGPHHSPRVRSVARGWLVSACLSGVLAQAGCESTETKTEAAPIVGVLELPIVQRTAGNPVATAAKIEISPSELRVDGEPVLTLQNGKVPAGEAVGYVLPKLKAKLNGKGGLAITAHAAVPYATLARVIDTGFEAGAKELAFQVRKPNTTKDTGWLTIRDSHFTDTPEDGKFPAGELLPWGSFAKVWEESLSGCQASGRADCGYSPIAKAEGGQLDMMLRVRGSGIAVRMRQAGAPEAAPAEAKPKKARAEMLDGIKGGAAPAEETPPEPATEHVFTLRADQATAVPSPISGITKPVCGSTTCPVVLDAEGISSTIHVLSLLGAAFPDGTPEPKVAWVLPPATP